MYVGLQKCPFKVPVLDKPNNETSSAVCALTAPGTDEKAIPACASMSHQRPEFGEREAIVAKATDG